MNEFITFHAAVPHLQAARGSFQRIVLMVAFQTNPEQWTSSQKVGGKSRQNLNGLSYFCKNMGVFSVNLTKSCLKNGQYFVFIC